MFRKILIWWGLTLFFALSILGQKKDLAICEEVESKIIQELVGTKLQQRDTYQKDCRLSIIYGSEKMLISIKIFDSEKENREVFSKQFDRLTHDIYDPPYGSQEINLNDHWGNAKGFKTDDSDHLVLLRYQRTQLTLIGSNYDLLLSIEPILRTVNFAVYEAELK